MEPAQHCQPRQKAAGQIGAAACRQCLGSAPRPRRVQWWNTVQTIKPSHATTITTSTNCALYWPRYRRCHAKSCTLTARPSSSTSGPAPTLTAAMITGPQITPDWRSVHDIVRNQQPMAVIGVAFRRRISLPVTPRGVLAPARRAAGYRASDLALRLRRRFLPAAKPGPVIGVHGP